MKRMLMVAVFVWISAVGAFAQTPADKGASAPKSELQRFDLEFLGGTPQEFVNALNKQLEGTLNVVIPDDSNDVQIPPVKLKNVNVADVFQALQRASQRSVPYKVRGGYQFAVESFGFSTQGVPTPNSVWAFNAIRSNPKLPVGRAYRFYQLGPYLDDLKIDDITTAIQTAEKMLNMGNAPELKFHPETKLLIAVGDDEGFDLIDEVLKALPKSGVKQARTAQALINGFVNKPGNISLPKDQKFTILDAIGQAGGLDVHSGGPKTIRFTRPGQQERLLQFDQLKKENDPAKIIYLEPGDVIDVGL